jgi:hypothetical protein
MNNHPVPSFPTKPFAIHLKILKKGFPKIGGTRKLSFFWWIFPCKPSGKKQYLHQLTRLELPDITGTEQGDAAELPSLCG